MAVNLRALPISVGLLLEQIQQQLMLSATAVRLLNSLLLILFAVLLPLTPSIAKRMALSIGYGW
nr:hypothetical protein [Serratia fonticola]